MTGAEQIEQSLDVLRGEIRRLESIGLQFAASLVRIAEVELQVRLHHVSDDEIDLLNQTAVEQGCDAQRTKN